MSCFALLRRISHPATPPPLPGNEGGKSSRNSRHNLTHSLTQISLLRRFRKFLSRSVGSSSVSSGRLSGAFSVIRGAPDITKGGREGGRGKRLKSE